MLILGTKILEIFMLPKYFAISNKLFKRAFSIKIRATQNFPKNKQIYPKIIIGPIIKETKKFDTKNVIEILLKQFHKIGKIIKLLAIEILRFSIIKLFLKLFFDTENFSKLIFARLFPI